MRIRGLAASIELSRVLEHAQDIADGVDLDLDTGHVLCALFIDENRAKHILVEKGLVLEKLLDTLKTLAEVGEPHDTVSVVHLKTAQFTESCGSEVVGTLHLLAGLCRVQKATAFQALERLGVRPAELRTAVIRLLSGALPKHYTSPSAAPLADRVGKTRQREREEDAFARGIVARTSPSGATTRTPEPSSYADDEDDDLGLVEAVPEPPSSRPAESPVPGRFREDGRHHSGTAIPAVRPGVSERAPKSRYALDPEQFPVLTKLGRNLTVHAERGELDPLVGRHREVEQLVDVLNKRRSNNPCLVGEPGVGKTAVVEGLAQLIVRRDGRVGALGEKTLLELDMGSIVAGTQLRGAFSERLKAIKDEVAKAGGRIVLFIDEIHTLIGAGAGDGALDAANELKTALARGDFPCIGSTTEREYRKYVESDPALARRFQVVLVDEPSPEDALTVLRGLATTYGEHHRVTYRDDAVDAAVRLSERWIFDRFLPAKAIDVLDLAGASASRSGRGFVASEDVARVVAQKAGIAEARLLETEPKRLLTLGAHLKARVIAHEDAMDRIAAVIRRNAAGFVTSRPMGSFLLLGPTGVGKTECARVLAEFLFGSREAVTRIDMSEYMDAHSQARLIGAPPGYVGHEDGGQLTEAVRRRPYQLVLFDEVEKASPEVLNLLLQLLEEGTLTDGRGRRVRFRNTVVMLTSNLGQSDLDQRGARSMGFGAAETQAGRRGKALESAEKAFSPELWNRIEEKLVFEPLAPVDIRAIAYLIVKDSISRLEKERGIRFEVDEAVFEVLVQKGFDARFGARPMRRVVQQLVENAVADAILFDGIPSGARLRLVLDAGAVAVQRLS